MLEDLDDLPKVQRVSSGGATSKCKTLKFVGKDHCSWKDVDFWDETEIDLDGSEIVYVEVNRNKPVNTNSFTGTNGSIASTLSTASEHIGDINLIGLKTAFLKTAAFRQGNFIHLDAYLAREYAKKAPKTFFKYEKYDLERFETINKKIDHDEVREIVEFAQSCKNSDIAGICERLGVVVEMTEDTVLQEKMDEWNDRHKMLKLLSDWEIRSNPKIVAEYISGKVKQ